MITTMLNAAAELLRAAEADPGGAVAPARRLARDATRAGDFAAASVAERALGVAALHLQNTDRAATHLRAAAAHGHRAGRAELEAEARLRLSAVLSTRGRASAALRETDAALAGLTGVQQARALAQKGAVLVQLVRLDDALANLERAIPSLRAAGDRMWLKRALANRGIVHGRRFEFVSAVADFDEALKINRDLGLDLPAAFVEQNLGWVHSLRGHVPLALEHLDSAEATLRRQGAQLGFLLEDRAALLLSVGLVAEARQVAGEAVTALRRERQLVAVPDVRLLLARLALADQLPGPAGVEARRAAAELRRLGRSETAELARFLGLAARAAGPDRAAVRLPSLRRTAQALDAAGWRTDAVAARLLAGELAAERGADPEPDLALAAAARRAGPVATRALGWQAEALRRQRRGRRTSALAALATGLRLLDQGRTGLGADDLRAGSGRQRLALSRLGLQMAVDGGRPETILAWAEQGRASHLLLPPLLPPDEVDEPELAADLAELRAASAELATARTGGQDVAGPTRRLVAVEVRIRDRSRRRPGVAGPVTRPVSVADLGRTLGDAALVEYVELDGALDAVTVVAGHLRRHRLGRLDGLRPVVDRLPFGLRRLARSPADAAAKQALLADAAARLDGALLAPLAAELGDRALVVVPTGLLQSLPWSLLPRLVGRPVTVAPSATTWHAASQDAQEPWQGTRRVVVLAGPGLPGAVREARAVARQHGVRARTEVGVDEALRTLAGADVAHLAAHGTVHPQNPLFSALRLADGPLTGYDLERLRPVPRLVVLAGCDTGRLAVSAGDELLGLAATLLSRGGRQVIASVVPVPDAETAPLMADLHARLVAGATPARALAEAQAGATGSGRTGTAAAAGFVCIGGGT